MFEVNSHWAHLHSVQITNAQEMPSLKFCQLEFEFSQLVQSAWYTCPVMWSLWQGLFLCAASPIGGEGGGKQDVKTTRSCLLKAASLSTVQRKNHQKIQLQSESFRFCCAESKMNWNGTHLYNADTVSEWNRPGQFITWISTGFHHSPHSWW